MRLNGIRLGTDLTSGGSSLRNTVVYEPSTQLYHLWVLANNDPNFPATSALGAFTHATSTDGQHFTSDGLLSYKVGSTPYQNYGATIDPPLDFVRVAFDTTTTTWKLFAWTENVGATVGQYNYNSSVNDLGSAAGNTSVLHQGPLQSVFAGNHAGTFGLVDDKLYLRVDSGGGANNFGGGDGQFDYTDSTPPATSAELVEANLFVGTPYCWLISSSCGTISDPRIPAYVHNVGRTLRQVDGTLATYYAFRHADASRIDKQVWFVSSNDNGATWSSPAGVFAANSTFTIDHQPIAGDGNFSSVESVQAPNHYRMYFSTKDALENFVMVSSLGSSSDTLFADGFEGCGD
ncbi:hypothetical protein ELE36_09475 [Pseudolysobacter antarcticus]|uniref:Exo-alpha-sialidase n=1 Tax=Pseudolysobacter antarcticus TaxID=2511995 RepID=A0A411HJL1_9GAMM|nr:hypothetical protein [Pseudolysobacter antarcticus]QBB70577.1 hypothetical protein ELE36_09475 [Pseudolysobacter antarcticus]